jgi:catechol 2,3-dioxygenase-like lactoylglutathione lyase family enzyme
MPTRFDHLVIAVRDLDASTRRYQRLGFDVRPGGRHPGRGTHNAIIRFGLDYIELLSVFDEVAARAHGPRTTGILDALGDREELLVGYALAPEDILAQAERFRGTAEFVGEPFAMDRTRPDGQQFKWRLFVPGGVSWRRPWPFLIQWDTPDDQRLQIEPPGTHPNGVTAWASIAVAVNNLERATELYQNRLPGLERQGQAREDRLVATRTTFQVGVGPGRIDLLTPEGAGPVQQALTEIGEGPIEVGLVVKDLDQTRAYLTQQGIDFVAAPDTLHIVSQETVGVRFFLKAIS